MRITGAPHRAYELRLKAASLGAALVVVCAVILSVVVRQEGMGQEGGVAFQPAEGRVTAFELASFMAAHARGALKFFAADTALAFGYLAAFIGLHAVASRRGPRAAALASLGMTAGVVMFCSDLIENGLYTKQALAALGVGVGSPVADLWRLHAVTAVKEGASWTTFGVFGLSLSGRPGRPRGQEGSSGMTRTLSAVIPPLLLLVPIVGAASLIWPVLVAARGMTVVLPMPLLAIWFHRLRATSDRVCRESSAVKKTQP